MLYQEVERILEKGSRTESKLEQIQKIDFGNQIPELNKRYLDSKSEIMDWYISTKEFNVLNFLIECRYNPHVDSEIYEHEIIEKLGTIKIFRLDNVYATVKMREYRQLIPIFRWGYSDFQDPVYWVCKQKLTYQYAFFQLPLSRTIKDARMKIITSHDNSSLDFYNISVYYKQITIKEE